MKLAARPRASVQLLGLAIMVVGLMMPGLPAAATGSGGSPEPTPVIGSSSPPLIPPYAGDELPGPVRTRQDRIVSTIAPIAMVVVLIAGLYIYWLIRKGL